MRKQFIPPEPMARVSEPVMLASEPHPIVDTAATGFGLPDYTLLAASAPPRSTGVRRALRVVATPFKRIIQSVVN
jgi:hypothetical protein